MAIISFSVPSNSSVIYHYEQVVCLHLLKIKLLK